MSTKAIYINDSYMPYLKNETRTQIFFGGSSSGKSFFLAQRVIMDVISGRNYLITRNIARTMRSSVFNQVIKTISDMGLMNEFDINGSNMVITCKRNRKQMLFAGLEDAEKLKSVTPIDGVITDAWLEEATECSYESYKQVTKRLRGQTKKAMKKRIILSFNPVSKEHWIYREFFGKWDDSKSVYSDNNLLIVKTTYKDNNFLTQDDIEALENESDPYYYDVYTLGKFGVLGNVIFKNWRMEDLSGIKHTFDNIYNGVDWGFSQDPNALIRVHWEPARKRIYVFDEFYKSGMMINEIEEMIRAHVGTEYITADSADPLLIAELCRQGLRVIPAVKGAGSIEYGVKFLQGCEIIIDVSCQNFKNEISTYHWQEDRYGNALRKPVDKNNHLLDALRYALETVIMSEEASSAKRIRF